MLQDSMLLPVLFSILTNDLVKDFNEMLMKSADDTKFRGIPHTLDDKARIQKYTQILDYWLICN